MNPEPISGRVSLVIAVSGHRDLYRDDYDDITDRICEELEKQCRNYPHTPILVLTGMAEGADRLAIIAVERLQKQFDIAWRPVLPMPREAFLVDFPSATSQKELEELLKGQIIFEIPIHEGNSFAQVCVEGSRERDQQYADLADFLVKTSQIVIAVWNGHETGHMGGTSELVKRKLGRFKPREVEAGEKECDCREDSYGLEINAFGTGPVIHIAARRKSMPDSSPEVMENQPVPDGTTEDGFRGIYLLLDEYNRDVKRSIEGDEKRGHARKAQTQAQDRSRELTKHHPVTNSSPAMRWTAEVFGWSDLLAARYQKRNLAVWKFAFAFLAIAGVGLHLWAPAILKLWSGSRLFVTLMYYLGVLAALAAWSYENGWCEFVWRKLSAWWARLFGKTGETGNIAVLPHEGLKFRRKHEDYRALAEALRVQYFWLADGMDHMAGESYLDKNAGDMIWVRDATSEALLYRFETAPEAAKRDQLSHSLGEIWIDSQLGYFTDREHKEKDRHHSITRWGIILAAPTFFVPGIRFLLSAHPECQPGMHETLGDIVPSLAMLIAVIGWNYADLRGYEQHAQQSRLMLRFYERAKKRLSQLHAELNLIESTTPLDEKALSKKKEEIRGFLYKVGKDALAENGDWLAMHRGRDLRIERPS